MNTDKNTEIPIILCVGQNGRAVVYGYVDREPQPGEPQVVRRARMILRWEGRRGLFGLAAHGPEEGSRITSTVAATGAMEWKQWLSVSPEAARAIDEWPAA